MEVNGLMLMLKNYIKIYLIFIHMFVTFFFFCLLLKVYFIQIRFTAIVVCSRAAQYLTQKEIGTIEKKNLQCIKKSFFLFDRSWFKSSSTSGKITSNHWISTERSSRTYTNSCCYCTYYITSFFSSSIHFLKQIVLNIELFI